MVIFIAPIIMLSIYIYIRDKYEKEPYKMVFTSIIIGVILSPIIIKIEEILMNNLYDLKLTVNLDVFIISFIIAALVEEVIKALFIYMFAIKNKEVNEPFDGIVYSVYIALGFAQVENMLYYISIKSYVNNNENDLMFDYIYELGMNRALTAIIIHVIYGVIMGYYLGKVKFESKNRLKNIFLSLNIPILIHGFYDYFVISYQYGLREDVIPSYAIIIINLIFVRKMVKDALKKSPFKAIYKKKKARKSYEKYIESINK